jgi:hypothetical protein
MIPICVLVELLAIVALIVGVPVPAAGTTALLAATPASAVTIWRTLKTDKTFNGVVDTAFYFSTWTSLPCLLALHATDGVGENVFRLIIAARVFAAVSLWKHAALWKKSAMSDVSNDGIWSQHPHSDAPFENEGNPND